jgi:hypothetical protein
MKIGVPLGVGALIVAVGIGGLAYYTQPVPRDETSLCVLPSAGLPEPRHHLLVVDKTDRWSAAQGARLKDLVMRMRDQLRLNERLSIFVFDNVFEPGFRPVFSLCNPGRASDTTIIWSNPRRWETRFMESFGKPLDDILDDLAAATEGPVSPLLELLIELSNREELNTGDVERRIVLVSDMLQHSGAYTLFGKPPPPPLDPSRIESMVELLGGLRHLHRFQLEIYQIRGVYAEERLAAARRFWDQIAEHYGAEIEWKVL